MLIGCLILTSCGGGGGDTEGGTGDKRDSDTTEPTQVTLSLSEYTQDTSQGKLIVVDYQGPAFDEDDLMVSVGDMPVASVVVNSQIHAILPLAESGQTLLAFDFGGFSSNLLLTIRPAPTIADPSAYVSGVIDDLVLSLKDSLPEYAYDALLEAEQELSNLSEDELSELAIFVKQNIEPVLQQLNSPVVTQYDEAACEEQLENFFIGDVTRAASSLGILLGIVMAAIPGYKLPGLVVIVMGVVASYVAIKNWKSELDLLFDVCLKPLFARISTVYTASVQVAQDPGAISRIRFDEDVARQVYIELVYRFEHERRSEVLGAIQNIGDVLLKVNDGLRQLVDRFPNLSQRSNINSFIDTIDGYISHFAGLENLERVEAANHANFRLGGISDANITGSVTSASTEQLVLEFNFEDASRVTQEDCVDFDFTLSNPQDGLEDVIVPASLCHVPLSLAGDSSHYTASCRARPGDPGTRPGETVGCTTYNAAGTAMGPPGSRLEMTTEEWDEGVELLYNFNVDCGTWTQVPASQPSVYRSFFGNLYFDRMLCTREPTDPAETSVTLTVTQIYDSGCAPPEVTLTTEGRLGIQYLLSDPTQIRGCDQYMGP